MMEAGMRLFRRDLSTWLQPQRKIMRWVKPMTIVKIFPDRPQRTDTFWERRKKI